MLVTGLQHRDVCVDGRKFGRAVAQGMLGIHHKEASAKRLDLPTSAGPTHKLIRWSKNPQREKEEFFATILRNCGGRNTAKARLLNQDGLLVAHFSPRYSRLPQCSL